MGPLVFDVFDILDQNRVFLDLRPKPCFLGFKPVRAVLKTIIFRYLATFARFETLRHR